MLNPWYLNNYKAVSKTDLNLKIIKGIMLQIEQTKVFGLVILKFEGTIEDALCSLVQFYFIVVNRH